VAVQHGGELADVLRSIETNMEGGSAHTCVADKPRKPAGPSAPWAVTMVAPIARSPRVRQKVLASITFGDGRSVSVAFVMSAPCYADPVIAN
jgi:hypothetical protein